MSQPTDRDPLPCIELVELLTAYLQGQLDNDLRQQVDDHLRDCDGCRNALDQWRTVATLTSHLTARDVADLDPYLRRRFLTALAALRRK